MSGYKRMRREHQAALLKLEEKCKLEMEAHKGALDKEYDNLLYNFTRELERLEVRILSGVFIIGKILSQCFSLLRRNTSRTWNDVKSKHPQLKRNYSRRFL